MPEGPEIYIKAERLRPHLIGQRVLKVKEKGNEYDVDSVITRLSTKGKKLWLELANNTYILFSFALEGDLVPYNSEVRKSRIIAELILDENEDKNNYFFIDVMGIARCVFTADLEDFLPKGIDPLHELFGMREWIALCKDNCTKQIARILVDQHFIAGIGNIYRSEVLHMAGIDPTAKMKDIDNIALEQLLVSIYRILGAAAKEKYTLQVHGRKVTPDGRPVVKVRIAKGLYVWSAIAKKVVASGGASTSHTKKKSSIVYLTDSGGEEEI